MQKPAHSGSKRIQYDSDDSADANTCENSESSIDIEWARQAQNTCDTSSVSASRTASPCTNPGAPASGALDPATQAIVDALGKLTAEEQAAVINRLLSNAEYGRPKENSEKL